MKLDLMHLILKVFNRKCNESIIDCKIVEDKGALVAELKKEILKKAKIIRNRKKRKKKKINHSNYYKII